MAAAGEGRWPNVKEQYELQEVIGMVVIMCFTKKISQCVAAVNFLPRLWSYSRGSSCILHSSQRTCRCEEDRLGEMRSKH